MIHRVQTEKYNMLQPDRTLSAGLFRRMGPNVMISGLLLEGDPFWEDPYATRKKSMYLFKWWMLKRDKALRILDWEWTKMTGDHLVYSPLGHSFGWMWCTWVAEIAKHEELHPLLDMRVIRGGTPLDFDHASQYGINHPNLERVWDCCFRDFRRQAIST